MSVVFGCLGVSHSELWPLPQARAGAERLVVFHDPSRKARDAYRNLASECRGDGVKVEAVEVDDRDLLEAAATIVRTLRKRAGPDSVLCLDGGSRTVSNAALLACVIHGTRPVYRQADDGAETPVPLFTAPYNEMLRAKPRSVLRFILAHPGCTAVEAARQLRLSKPTISHHVKRLVDLGLIERRRDGQDQRRAILSAVPTIGLLFERESEGSRRPDG